MTISYVNRFFALGLGIEFIRMWGGIKGEDSFQLYRNCVALKVYLGPWVGDHVFYGKMKGKSK